MVDKITPGIIIKKNASPFQEACMPNLVQVNKGQLTETKNNTLATNI